jgi:hypothetical protein
MSRFRDRRRWTLFAMEVPAGILALFAFSWWAQVFYLPVFVFAVVMWVAIMSLVVFSG